MKILFLYTELAEYVIKSCEALAKDAEVHIIRWPVNKEAPFEFEFPAALTVYNKADYSPTSLKSLVDSISPDLLVCSGWIDKDYLKVVKSRKGQIPTVLALDTHWAGTLKQQLARVLSPFFIKTLFSHAWVPGTPQKKYAVRLGFPEKNIRTGFYSCDLSRFNSYYHSALSAKRNRFPRRFVFAGRYYRFKGVRDLWEAFAGLSEAEKNGWELWCMGTGTELPEKAEGIKHLGFVQPRDLGPVLEQTGVFVLPSHFEPWAVVVQEFAAAGFPLLLSNAVGASEAFLREGKNGYSFPSGDVKALRTLLKKIASLSDKELHLMAEKSHELAQYNGPVQWAATALDIYNDWHKK